MSFLEKIGFIETPEQGRERLAQAPEGSKTHALSQLPVTIEGWPEDLVIELPWAETGLSDEQYRIVVVPFKYSADALPTGAEDHPLPHKRHSGWWDCIVIASTNPSYRVGGYRLTIPSSELARGKQIDVFELQRAAADVVPF